MKSLFVYGKPVETVFELLGSDEDAMTNSLGWALVNCERFRANFASLLNIHDEFSENIQVRLQNYQNQKGFTDLEIFDPGSHHIIIEAKRGFAVPSIAQLEKYATRMDVNEEHNVHNLLVVLAESDSDEQWLGLQVPGTVNDIPVIAVSWKSFLETAKCSFKGSSNTEKLLLGQFINYLNKVTSMQNQYSNNVYVVSLSTDLFCEDPDIRFIDIVKEYEKYFHPVGGGRGGWPTQPPNYIAFRYYGKLQSIHHVESYTVIDNFFPHFPVPNLTPTESPLYLYTLGPAITPPNQIPTNDPNNEYPNLYGPGRKWCFLDLLFTCGSIAEAAVKSRKRDNKY